jgi:hypothetical protein
MTDRLTPQREAEIQQRAEAATKRRWRERAEKAEARVAELETLNWHRNDVGCTVDGCTCARFYDPASQEAGR